VTKKLKLPARQSLGVGGKTEQKIEEKNTQNQDIFDTGGELVVDVFETGTDFVILTAIAGAQIKDLDISVEDEMMIIKGERQNPHHHHSDKRYFYQECYWGSFSRKIVLPENVDAEAAEAEMDKGILTIKIPKRDIKTS